MGTFWIIILRAFENKILTHVAFKSCHVARSRKTLWHGGEQRDCKRKAQSTQSLAASMCISTSRRARVRGSTASVLQIGSSKRSAAVSRKKSWDLLYVRSFIDKAAFSCIHWFRRRRAVSPTNWPWGPKRWTCAYTSAKSSWCSMFCKLISIPNLAMDSRSSLISRRIFLASFSAGVGIFHRAGFMFVFLMYMSCVVGLYRYYLHGHMCRLAFANNCF